MRQAQTMLNVFRGLPPGTISPESLDVRVLNGTPTDGMATDAAGALEAIGFTIADVDSYETSDVTRTTVLYAPLGEAGARRVAAHITGGAALVPSDALGIDGGGGGDRVRLHHHPRPAGARRLAGRSPHHDVDGGHHRPAGQ